MKGLRHIQIHKNAIREAIAANIIQVKHIAGSVNLADLFTKEDKDAQQFISLRDQLMEPLPTI